MQRRKTEIVTARMTPKVKAQLQQRARDTNMTLTDYLCICELIDRYADLCAAIRRLTKEVG